MPDARPATHLMPAEARGVRGLVGNDCTGQTGLSEGERPQWRALAYCGTAWDGPGGGLAELIAAVHQAAAAYGLRLGRVWAELVDDDVHRRATPLLAEAIDAVHDGGVDILLVAESPTLIRSRGVAASMAEAAGLTGNRVITVETADLDLAE